LACYQFAEWDLGCCRVAESEIFYTKVVALKEIVVWTFVGNEVSVGFGIMGYEI
jgi:hypothetical protein